MNGEQGRTYRSYAVSDKIVVRIQAVKSKIVRVFTVLGTRSERPRHSSHVNQVTCFGRQAIHNAVAHVQVYQQASCR